MPNFIEDYLFYNSGNECHPKYHLWAAINILAAATGPRVHFPYGGKDGYGQLDFWINLYIGLVGTMGSRKTVAKDIAKDFLYSAIPDMPFSSNVESVRSITVDLSSDLHKREYTDELGQQVIYRPLILTINELKNYISIDPVRMTDFLTDIFDQKVYRHKIKGVNGAKSTELDEIHNPFVNILACGTTEYMADLLRDTRAAGGLARRFIFVIMNEPIIRNSKPSIPQGGREARERCIQHLRKLQTISGTFQWETPDDEAAYDKWYNAIQTPTEMLLAGFYNSKHVQAFKIAMVLALGEYEPKLVLSWNKYLAAVEMIEDLEPEMARLYASAGRNEFMTPMVKMLDKIRQGKLRLKDNHILHGIISKVDLFKAVQSDLEPRRILEVFDHLCLRTRQIHIARINNEEYACTVEAWLEINKRQSKP